MTSEERRLLKDWESQGRLEREIDPALESDHVSLFALGTRFQLLTEEALPWN